MEQVIIQDCGCIALPESITGCGQHHVQRHSPSQVERGGDALGQRDAAAILNDDLFHDAVLSS